MWWIFGRFGGYLLVFYVTPIPGLNIPRTPSFTPNELIELIDAHVLICHIVRLNSWIKFARLQGISRYRVLGYNAGNAILTDFEAKAVISVASMGVLNSYSWLYRQFNTASRVSINESRLCGISVWDLFVAGDISSLSGARIRFLPTWRHQWHKIVVEFG